MRLAAHPDGPPAGSHTCRVVAQLRQRRALDTPCLSPTWTIVRKMWDRYSVNVPDSIEASDLFLPKMPGTRYMIQHAYRFRQCKMAAPTKMIHSVAARANVVVGIPVDNTKPAVRNNMSIRFEVRCRDFHRKPQKVFDGDALFLQCLHRVTEHRAGISRIGCEPSGNSPPLQANLLSL